MAQELNCSKSIPLAEFMFRGMVCVSSYSHALAVSLRFVEVASGVAEQGIRDCAQVRDQWDEAEMCIFVERWVDQAVNEYHIPVHVLAQRAQVSNAEMWSWHQHVTDTVGLTRGRNGEPMAAVEVKPSAVTGKIYHFLLKELSCEVCSGRLCRCCFSFCGVCEQLHCKTCSANCVRCEDCLAFFDTGEWCAECGDDFCGCARDALHCDHCKEGLCSRCASIFPCFNCRKGYCLVKNSDDDVTGCAIRDSLWMCPDCRSVGCACHLLSRTARTLRESPAPQRVSLHCVCVWVCECVVRVCCVRIVRIVCVLCVRACMRSCACVQHATATHGQLCGNLVSP